MAPPDETPGLPTADAQPSPSPEPSPAPSPSPESAAPSAEDTGKSSKETLLDAVLKVVPATTETDVLKETEDKAAPEADTKPQTEDQAETETDEPDDDEPPPPETSPAIRKKINKLLKQRREMRDELSAIRPAAEIGTELQNFATQNDLSGDDVTNTLHIAAMLRAGDYKAFYEAISPFVRTAQEYLGIVLPRSLQEQVSKGQITEAAAKTFARQHYEAERAKFERDTARQVIDRQAVQSVQTDVQRAVSNFELRLSASDPDYKAKAPAVRRVAQAMLFERGGTIDTLQDAIDITKAAYDEVNKQVRSYQPRPIATAQKPNGASQTPSARPAPKTLMEAALQGLETARRTGG
jgi:hypothetical protein